MRRPGLIVLALLALLPATAAAQARSDQARLSFGIGLGYNGATSIWRVDGQELLDNAARDTVTVWRDVRSTIGVVFLGTYYPDDHWGFTGEAHLVGLAFTDGCARRSNSGSVQNAEVCDNINGQNSRGSAVTTTVGVVYRPLPWRMVQPYLRTNVGVLLSQQSSVRMRGTFKTQDPDGIPGDSVYSDYYVFQDKHPASISPTVGLVAGMTFFFARAYQLRVEAKDNIVSLERVTSTAPVENAEPTSDRRYHHVFSLTIGGEVVLEKRRGRRY
jgi:hypothetical protein